MNRRRFLRTSFALGASALAPAIVRAEQSIPQLPQGVAAGDAGRGRAVVWSRCDRPARLHVEYSTTSNFANARSIRGAAALPSSDHTARVVLTDLPPGQQIFYRARFQSLEDLRAYSEPLTGSFSTALASATRDVTIAWSADTCGQGWGINPAFGGLRLYETMLQAAPDLFVHCGDTIYADAPLQPMVTLDDGTLWQNIVTPAKLKVAESLDEFRGNYHYNLLDEHMRRFNAQVQQAALWDDHEVRDNWYDEKDLSRDDRYTVRSNALLAARARQAFFENHPLPSHADEQERIYRTIVSGPLVDVFALDLRSYRAANSENTQPVPSPATRILGADQLAWLKTQLTASRGVWKVIASDMPLGLVVRDGPAHFEAIANGDDAGPRGRELEIADLLRALRDNNVRNVVWITGDVHYCAAHHYDPARARFRDFSPFWEFVAGPLHSGTFGPNPLDLTFGPEVKFQGVPADMKPNRPPSDGLQFFGTLRVNARTRALTASLHNLAGKVIYTQELSPE